MDLITFLQTLVASDGAHVAAAAAVVGLLDFGTIQFINKLVQPSMPDGLPSRLKFYGSIALAFLYPLLGYVGLQLLTHQAVTAAGFFLAAFTGWMVSQSVRYETK